MKVSLTHVSVLITAFATQISAYDCWKNIESAQRWRDAKSPADRAVELCKLGDGEHCHDGEIGRMCVSGPGNEDFCNFVWGWVGSAQSFHADWWLWEDITCDGGQPGSADDLHIRILR
ncbi:hypothetical protein EJ04DRAFT_274348 [Polyplosphaeria fusca]|uniref:Uncharacterized protein n=1 Tax=Polyplosphaeria fusca TaxID=682080 RepID=A0A9P4V1R6_9PLEO|nr:hypothetical protein EJ04DRAFT_274348 [Polyplosphaeria fusca]